MTHLFSILLISITDACVPLILRLLINVAGLFRTQVLNTSTLPTRVHEDFWFHSPHLTGVCEPLWGWSFSSHPGTFLSCGDYFISPPAAILDAVLFQMQNFSGRFVMGSVSAQASRSSTTDPQMLLNLCGCFSCWLSSLSLRLEPWVERREVDPSYLIPCPSLPLAIYSSTEMFLSSRKWLWSYHLSFLL